MDGIPGLSADDEILRMTSMIHSGIEPRIVVQMKAVVGAKGPLLVVRVAKAWNGPGMVKFNGAHRFLGRNNSGKLPMDVNQIRAAFLGGAELSDRARLWRDERLAQILVDDTPAVLPENPRALAGDVQAANAAARQTEPQQRQATIIQELHRLTDALAAGGDSRSLREGVR